MTPRQKNFVKEFVLGALASALLLGLVVFGLCLFAGCSPRAPLPGGAARKVGIGAAHVSTQTIRSLLFTEGVPSEVPFFCDDDYVLPTRSWVLGEFAKAWMAYNFSIEETRWEDPANDCDKFSRRCAAFAGDLYFHDPARVHGAGLCFGELIYTRDIGKRHAICFAVTWENNKMQLVLFEPQKGTEAALSQNERNHCVLTLVQNAPDQINPHSALAGLDLPGSHNYNPAGSYGCYRSTGVGCQSSVERSDELHRLSEQQLDGRVPSCGPCACGRSHDCESQRDSGSLLFLRDGRLGRGDVLGCCRERAE